MLRVAIFTAAIMLAAGPANADWIERAWDDAVTSKTGSPAITLTEAGVLVTLPETALAEAHAAGLETRQAVQLFIQRYGQHCSAIFDLDRPHQQVKVQLSILSAVPFEDASARVQSEVLDALKATQAKRQPPIETLFVVSDEHRDFVIDYVPEHRASCVRPGDPTS